MRRPSSRNSRPPACPINSLAVSLCQLVARIRALLRRAHPEPTNMIILEYVKLDLTLTV